MGSQRVRHDWVTELNWTQLNRLFKTLTSVSSSDKWGWQAIFYRVVSKASLATSTCYLLTSLNSTSLASLVVSWKWVTFSQNSLQSRKNGTTFILRYHVLQSKLRVSFLTASTINFPRLSKQQAIGQQKEPSLQKSIHPSQSWVHFIRVTSGGDYVVTRSTEYTMFCTESSFLEKAIISGAVTHSFKRCLLLFR